MPSRAVAKGGLAGAFVLAAATAIACVGIEVGVAAWTALALVPVVAWIAWQDLADFTIPDVAVLALGVLGAASRVADGVLVGDPLGATATAIALDLVLSGGLLLALREVYYRRRGEDGIGFGDVKLGAAGGVLAGTTGFAWALFGASLAGLAIVLAFRRKLSPRSSAKAPDKLPFGAIFAPALWLTWLIGQAPGLSSFVR